MERFGAKGGWWAAWFAAQVIGTIIFKLVENAMLGWGDDQIAAWFGITSPTLSTVITWTIPFILAFVTLWVFHRVTTRPLKEALKEALAQQDRFSATGVVSGSSWRIWIQRVEPSHLITIGVIGTIIFGMIAVGGLVWQNLRSPANSTSVESTNSRVPTQEVAPALSTGEQQFRTELRRFIKSIDEIRDGVYAVNQFITSKYDESRGSQTNPLSRMFLQLFTTAIRPHIDEVDRAYDLHDGEFDTSVVQDLIKKAMQSYAQWQENVLQFQQVSGISLADRSLRILLGVSTPEEKCIDFPEQKYISEAGKKGR